MLRWLFWVGAPQLATVREVDGALREEYALRRRMLVERAKVTLQSFLWSGRLKEKVRRGRVHGCGCGGPGVAGFRRAREGAWVWENMCFA